jgi:non-homologous end joining protein Ku
MTSDFNADKYADKRQQKILELLKKKVKGKALVETPEVEKEAGEGPVDLIAVLEESMRKVKANR